MNKHTPGPWHTTREGFSTVYVEARIGGGWIQEVAACGPTEGGSDEQEANARLIAAAPELLDALNALCAIQESGDVASWAGEWDQARAAIAKATGEQP